MTIAYFLSQPHDTFYNEPETVLPAQFFIFSILTVS